MKNLKLLRKTKKMTMKELGDKIGVSESTISLYENGKREPNIETLIKIITFFNVSLDILILEDLSSNLSCLMSGTNQNLTEEQKEILPFLQDLSRDEADKIIEYIEFLKTKRKQ